MQRDLPRPTNGPNWIAQLTLPLPLLLMMQPLLPIILKRPFLTNNKEQSITNVKAYKQSLEQICDLPSFSSYRYTE